MWEGTPRSEGLCLECVPPGTGPPALRDLGQPGRGAAEEVTKAAVTKGLKGHFKGYASLWLPWELLGMWVKCWELTGWQGSRGRGCSSQAQRRDPALKVALTVFARALACGTGENKGPGQCHDLGPVLPGLSFPESLGMSSFEGTAFGTGYARDALRYPAGAAEESMKGKVTQEEPGPPALCIQTRGLWRSSRRARPEIQQQGQRGHRGCHHACCCR